MRGIRPQHLLQNEAALLLIDLKSQFIIAAGTFSLCELLRFLLGKFFQHSRNNHHWVHTAKTPRVGGIAIFMASIAILVMQIMTNGAEGFVFVFLFFVSAIFCLGALEDWLGGIPAVTRLIFTAVIVFFNCLALLGLSASKDGALIYIFLVILWGAGISLIHGSNLIDGVNGLSITWATSALIILGGILTDISTLNMSQKVSLAEIIAVFTACSIGFLATNFPFGRVFLGDAGAYLGGAVVFFVAVFIVLHTSDYRVWSQVIAVVSFPVLELLWTLIRRFHIDKTNIFQPDKKHLHTLMIYSLASFFPRWDSKTTNNVASLMVIGTVVQSTWWVAVFMPNSLLGCAMALLVIPLVYFLTTLVSYAILSTNTR